MMRTGVFLDYSGGFREAVEHIVVLEKAGVNLALVAEAYSFDAVSQLGYLAAKTSTIELGSGVFPIYTRTPALMAMTAMTTKAAMKSSSAARKIRLTTAVKEMPT